MERTSTFTVNRHCTLGAGQHIMKDTSGKPLAHHVHPLVPCYRISREHRHTGARVFPVSQTGKSYTSK